MLLSRISFKWDEGRGSRIEAPGINERKRERERERPKSKKKTSEGKKREKEMCE